MLIDGYCDGIRSAFVADLEFSSARLLRAGGFEKPSDFGPFCMISCLLW
ncbi:hypothetical protein NBRC3257_3138 [Gluconobacter thailandicus NBRC 3257]|uniref:Uncharacterized protein n=1 Tax=Gluconobacter thailandicus NBRC 3257 TaxID=1381097 RepID=A0ABQ0J121_GLUTH|nr:hypothetical protein NBRC3255_2907 [Gluconobacter thailandicus NBRC 3255]GAD28139.1 hypothetical protein NBRC3257_3138 [Gluconobacter thailandicus NBRC 3257]